MTSALNVERVKKEEYDRKEKRQGKKNPGHYRDQLKNTESKTILPASSVASAPGDSSRGLAPPYCKIVGEDIKEIVGD